MTMAKTPRVAICVAEVASPENHPPNETAATTIARKRSLMFFMSFSPYSRNSLLRNLVRNTTPTSFSPSRT